VNTTAAQELFESRDIRVFDYGNNWLLPKQIGAGGNSIDGWLSSPVISFTDASLTVAAEVRSDCPVLQLQFNGDAFSVVCWNWVPGPGPGDFELEFKTLQAAADAVLHYFFGQNDYFEARKAWQLKQAAQQNQQTK
jgi:hypothetical protein